MFSAAHYKAMTQRMIDARGEDVTLRVKTSAGYTSHPKVRAAVSSYRERDLVPGGSIQLGDLRLVIPAANLPSAIEVMGRKDLIEINNREHGVIHWDDRTRRIAGELIAVEIGVRG